MNEEIYWLGIGWDGARIYCADPDCEWSERIERCDRLWGSFLDTMIGGHVEMDHGTYALRCTAAFSMKGVHYQCCEPQDHGGAHRNEEIGAVWGAVR